MPLDATAMPPVLSAETLPASLAETARADMERVFATGERAGKHRPSPPQWAAIVDYLEHAEMAADGNLKLAVYLSAIPCGTGKSVAVASFSRAVAQSADHDGVGVLIAVNRLSEARDMADALKDQRAKLCLIVGKTSAGDMQPLGGHLEADAAQIVITTHAALKETLRRTRDFNRTERYFYRGARRRVVMHDEAIAFNRPVVLDGDAVLKLAAALRRQSPDAVAALKRWSSDLEEHRGGLCAVPDFMALGVDFARLEQDADSDDQAAQARALSIISGEAGHVLRSNAKASNLVTYIPELPPSLLPVLVTDASAAAGINHASYEQMRQTRPIIRLREAAKSYANLTLRIIPTAASRSTYRKPNSHEGRDLVEMIVRYVQSVAPAPALVVSYKAPMAIHGVQERTIREAVNARLTPAEQARTRHLTWGTHTATNAHTDVAHLVFAGLNFLPESAAYAASGAALSKPMNTTAADDHPSADQVKEMERGALRDSTLQAVLRGAARMGVDGDCGRQEVVLPQAPQTGLTDADLRGMFPGCRIVRDVTLMPPKPLKGNLKRLADAVQRRLEAGDWEMTDASLYGEVGIAKSNHGKLKAKPEWAAWLGSMGLHQAKLGGGLIGLRRAG